MFTGNLASGRIFETPVELLPVNAEEKTLAAFGRRRRLIVSV
jgi:hypothetical protein